MMRVISLLLLLVAPLVAEAHRFAPSALDVRALTNGEISVVWKTPAQATSNVPMLPIKPDDCEVLSETPWFPEGTGKVLRQQWACAGESLEGLTLGVSGLAANQSSAVVSMRPHPDVFFQEVLTADSPSFTVPAQRSGLATALHYLWLGAEHIAIGTDHLFFVAGLLLLVGWGVRLVYTVTAFTVGHSITLALVSLGFVTNPEALIEWLIAVSIWVLALELSRPEHKSRLWDKPWYLAGGFGLLHGMGFAGALAETGLPQMHLPTALLFFNVGIEVGQLAFIALLTLAGAMISKISRAPWLQIAPVYLLGAVSTFWVLDRTGSLFG
jgi:hypothetical protein